MRRLRSIFVAVLVTAAAGNSGAFELPEGMADVHGRLESVVEIDPDAEPFSGNFASRSYRARSRLMSSVEAAAPNREQFGRLYLKGVARWSEADTDGDVEFKLDQGDYLWRRRGSVTHAVRVFGNERRYFTYSLSPPILDDDAVAAYENHGGIRVDGSSGIGLSWSALGGLLDDGSDDARGLGFAALRWRGAGVQASASYLSHQAPAGAEDYRGVVKGEIAGLYRRATVVLAYQQAGADESFFFLPRTAFDWDGYVGGNFSESLPADADAFGEIRVRDVAFRDRVRVDFFHRYRATGSRFAPALSGGVPGVVANTTGLFFSHRELALDGRLVYRTRVRSALINQTTEHLEAYARAVLTDGTEVYLRGAAGYRETPGGGRSDDHFVHAAWKRSMRRLEAGVHLMVIDDGGGELERRFALETRMNWSASIALYGRVIAADEAGSRGAAYCRLEVRPAGHVFATLAYGRGFVGDGPYVLEDPDIDAAGDIEPVYTFSVRGDF
jgi:hypothetical protein